jgi:pimeloyl-ACP methyl ester carboxylesterase
VAGSQEAVIEINGLKLHYLEWNPDGEQNPAGKSVRKTIVLLHGSNGNAHVWDQFGTRAGSQIRTLALHLRGHGDSQWSRPPAYRCEDYTGDLEQFIAKLDVGPVVLVAHSMSVYHSIRCAVSHPHTVARLVLIDIEAAARSEHVRLLRVAGSKPEPLFESFERAFARERRFFPFADENVLRDFLATNLREVPVEGAGSEGAQAALTYKYDRATLAEFEAYDEWSRLGQIRCPTMFVYGADSQLVRPEVMQRMVEAVPGSIAVRIERAGHMPHMDNPIGFAEAVLPFCLGKTNK